MEFLDELIQFENENTSLDFKAVQYSKEKHEALLKDLLAMANSHGTTDRYIIVGVNHKSDGTRDFVGVDSNEFVDSATYHQLVRENIEPELHFTYLPHKMGNISFGIFRIFDCTDRPYMMRKQFGRLNVGDTFVRKGTHQPRMMRSDLDRMLLERSEHLSRTVEVIFEGSRTPAELVLRPCTLASAPSKVATEKIKGILADRERRRNDPLTKSSYVIASAFFGSKSLGYLSGSAPYEQWTDDELLAELNEVADVYEEEDLYYLYEENAVKVNLQVLNAGNEYIENASVTLEIPCLEGLVVPDRIYNRPIADPLTATMVFERQEDPKYPRVRKVGDTIQVAADIGDLRHGISTHAFGKPLRLVVLESLSTSTVDLRCKVYGKQLRAPVEKLLRIKVEPS